jgi:hypothetical protein
VSRQKPSDASRSGTAIAMWSMRFIMGLSVSWWRRA